MAKPLHQNVCEEQIYKTVYDSHAEDLYKQLYYKYGEHLNPQDKVQEAFIKLWQNCKDVLPNKAKGYVYTVANNLMLNAFKHKKVVLKYAKNHAASVEHEDPQFLMETDEYLKKYQHALSFLTEKQREVFLLNRIEGKRHKAIAEQLDISQKAVEKRLYAAIKVLKNELVELKGRSF